MMMHDIVKPKRLDFEKKKPDRICMQNLPQVLSKEVMA